MIEPEGPGWQIICNCNEQGRQRLLFLEGTALGRKKDKQDIKSRAHSVRANAKKRHAQEKATLAFCRLMIYHKVQPRPSSQEDALIDKLIRELADAWELVESRWICREGSVVVCRSRHESWKLIDGKRECRECSVVVCRIWFETWWQGGRNRQFSYISQVWVTRCFCSLGRSILRNGLNNLSRWKSEE